MCIYDYDYRTKQEVEKDQKNYNLESLIGSLSRLDEVAQQINQNLATRRAALVDQIKKVENTQFRPFVLVHRNEYTNSGKVELTVYRKMLPNSPLILDLINATGTIQGWKNGESHTYNRGEVALKRILLGYDLADHWFPLYDKKEFAGTERKKALTYAQELAQEHKATVVKAGF